MRMLDFLYRRSAHWHVVLALYAYELTAPAEIHADEGILHLRARRPASYGGPNATIDVREMWRDGNDTDHVMPAVDWFHLHRSSWHLQIGSGGPRRAERIDIDRSKPTALIRHRHPYGSANDVREPTAIGTPEAWMVHAETIVSLEYVDED